MRNKSSIFVFSILVVLLANTVGFGKTVISLWSWHDAIGEFTARKAEEFNQMQDEVEVIVELHPFDGYFDKLQMAQVSGVAPELLRGGFEDLIDVYPEDFYEPTLVEYMRSQELPFFEDFIEDDGKVYAYPFSLWTTPLWYNRELFAEAGLGDKDVPKTWDELTKVAKKLTKIGPDGQILQAGFTTEPTDFLQVYLPQAVPEYFQIGDKEVKLTGTKAQDAYGFFLDLIENQIIPWPSPAWSGEQFLNQTAAMTFLGTWFYGAAQTASFDWGVAAQPRPSEDAAFGATCVASDWRFGYGLDEEARGAGTKFYRFLLNEDNSVECALATGLLPTQLGHYQAEEIAGNQFFQVAASVLSNSAYKLDGTVWDAVWGALIGAVSDSLYERVHPNQAVEVMENRINTALADYYR
ncbi:MAG: extracellular solute-binding protein [Limnochordia bacterium]|nr:extracellular solute-binding protein [Limnochordia bacterium]